MKASASGRPVITALGFDLSANPVVRMDPILKVLSQKYEVQTLGPVNEKGVFEPYRESRVYETFSSGNLPGLLPELFRASKRIRGDVILAFKPRMASFGLGLFHCLLHRKPLVLDIEDWEMAHGFSEWHDKDLLTFLRRYVIHGWKSPDETKYLAILDLLARANFEKLVVSDFLMNIYGGRKLYHGPDTDFFDPARFNRARCLESFGLNPEHFHILFAGTPRPHKGLDHLLQALEMIPGGHRLKILAAGGNVLESLGPELLPMARDRVVSMGFLPHHRMPDLLAASDLVALPQKRNPVAAAQVPAKVFEAMAMARPVVATALSDLPSILSGCGVIVQPGDVSALAQAIGKIASSRELADYLGRAARARCVELYSHQAMGRVLFPLFDSLLADQL